MSPEPSGRILRKARVDIGKHWLKPLCVFAIVVEFRTELHVPQAASAPVVRAVGGNHQLSDDLLFAALRHSGFSMVVVPRSNTDWRRYETSETIGLAGRVAIVPGVLLAIVQANNKSS
jgi:hypothetical protein